MKNLGSIEGAGKVIPPNGEPFPVNYRVSVFLSRQAKSARGTLTGELGALHQLMGVGDLILETEDGKTVKFLVERLTNFDHASIVIKGPVPDF